MREFRCNHYEQAFENWLIDHRIDYVAADEHRRAEISHQTVKSPDFLLYPSESRAVIAEVKGRKFHGTSLAKLAGFECWVTADDVDGLTQWRDVLGDGYEAVFVFAYRMENVDVDFDGRKIFEFGAAQYLFFCIRLDDYRLNMKRRSPKWRTVTLPAEKFRQCAIEIGDFLL
ncbi:MAG: HYExAFE family protein [Sedimentisphaerales bacterium]|nr:HYExAFE family protein [Sedimentisphaerales bacterium]